MTPGLVLILLASPPFTRAIIAVRAVRTIHVFVFSAANNDAALRRNLRGNVRAPAGRAGWFACRRACARACRGAGGAFGSTVTLVRATVSAETLMAETAGPGNSAGDVGMIVDPTPILEADRAEATEYLELVAERLRQHHVTVNTEHPEGPPAEEIVDAREGARRQPDPDDDPRSHGLDAWCSAAWPTRSSARALPGAAGPRARRRADRRRAG